MNQPKKQDKEFDLQKYLPQNMVVFGLMVIVVILAMAAGYYHSLYTAENKKYLRLEDNYVRVRNILGRGQTQALIDLSHEADGSEILQELQQSQEYKVYLEEDGQQIPLKINEDLQKEN